MSATKIGQHNARICSKKARWVSLVTLRNGIDIDDIYVYILDLPTWILVIADCSFRTTLVLFSTAAPLIKNGTLPIVSVDITMGLLHANFSSLGPTAFLPTFDSDLLLGAVWPEIHLKAYFPIISTTTPPKL